MDETVTISLIDEAIQAKRFAYAKYSNFNVGASVLADEAKIFSGCNIENASYGATVCAERVALYSAISRGVSHISAVCIISDSVNIIKPCGICLQVICEFNPMMKVICCANNREYEIYSATELIPHPFVKT